MSGAKAESSIFNKADTDMISTVIVDPMAPNVIQSRKMFLGRTALAAEVADGVLAVVPGDV